jgi:spore maturation protein CgeB
MKLVMFCHAFSSCWNNGNAHFLRGVARELAQLGHSVTVFEPAEGWSRTNALADAGNGALADMRELVPGVAVRGYADLDLDDALDGADAVLVHEWNAPELIAAIGRRRIQGGRFVLLFHDTHHRAITAPEELSKFDLGGFDGVLAFGAVLRDIYASRGWARRAFTWHEAADVALFHPIPGDEKQDDIVWIGNWGDDERSAEIAEFLIEPSRRLQLTGTIYGVRYPQHAIDAISASGLRYGGWLPNHQAPLAFAGARATVHVPRGPYARQLPGIPTIRVFEALACGIPLVSAPWDDCEQLFPSASYIKVSSGAAMEAALSSVLNDPQLAASLVENGLRAIAERHTCRHRVVELLAIIEDLQGHGRAQPQVALQRAAS